MNGSVAWLAATLVAVAESGSPEGLLVVVDGDGKAEALARLTGQMDPDRTSLCFPAWDCLPYDRAAPAADIMGHRMRVLHDLTSAQRPILVITTPEALVRRLPPRERLPAPLIVKVGTTLEPGAFGSWCARYGYAHADRVEEPGHLAMRGEVIDVFPATPKPYRITVIDGAVSAIHRYDPVSQRTSTAVQAIRIDAVSEIVPAGDEPVERFAGMEHWLPAFYPSTETLLDVMPAGTRLLIEPQAEIRLGQTFAAIPEAHHDRLAADKADPNNPRKPIEPQRAFLVAAEWERARAALALPFPGGEAAGTVPRFCLDDKPGRAFAAFLNAQRKAGRRIVLGATRREDLKVLAKEANRVLGTMPATLERWRDVMAMEAGAAALMKLAADHGFVDHEAGVTLITAADLLGQAARASSYHAAPVPWHMGDGEFAPGDIVVHLDHGVGVLKGLETLEAGAASGRDTLRIDFAKDATLLTPVEELDRVWRYGAAQAGVPLARLDSDGWQTRRAQIARELDETARRLVALARQRDATQAPQIVPPRRDYERVGEGVAFAPTPDQIHAIDDCLRDLASGRPMDRLVVGDVGFGKTEVALRAAAAAVLSGWQVAVVAPTTVLVRQHVHTFEKRFAALGIPVAQLSRLVPPAEARRTKEGLADGSIGLVVGTHALAAEDVRFDKLGLLIVDEEQRFGAVEKARIRDRGTGVHVLTLSATPIPRTLQSALVGLQELSIIATPPARRRPIRTLVAPFDTATVRTALLREKARGGQSFVVVPRIEDLETLAAQFGTLLPELKVLVGHGRMEAQAVDEAMVQFASGEGDVLLATSIIESGLDVPRANTMVVCEADRFGLAQLHQIRGRVGRGRQQGTCYLMTDPEHPIAERTSQRLATLATLDRLGSGMAISAQDLDARGAGDLMGEDQAGHAKLIGLGLYQHLLQLAIRQARGDAVADWTPELHVDLAGHLDPAYIPESTVRLNLYARLARVSDTSDAAALAEEIEDRFGPLPEAVEILVALARLRSQCLRHGIARLDAGPKALALTPRGGRTAEALCRTLAAHVESGPGPAVKHGRVVLAFPQELSSAEQIHVIGALLEAVE